MQLFFLVFLIASTSLAQKVNQKPVKAPTKSPTQAPLKPTTATNHTAAKNTPTNNKVAPQPVQVSQKDDPIVTQAKADLAEVTRDLSEANQATAFDPCKYQQLITEKKYIEGFIRDAETGGSLPTSFIAASAWDQLLQSKINLLNTPVQVRPDAAQEVEAVTISFELIQRYFSLLNQRSAHCTQSQFADLLKLHRYSATTSLGVSHDQILQALQLYANRLNSSINDDAFLYQFSIIQNQYQFVLRLNVIETETGKIQQSMVIPQTGGQDACALIENQKQMNEADQYFQTHVDEDALTRIRNAESKLAEKTKTSCGLVYQFSPHSLSLKPYLSLQELRSKSFRTYPKRILSWVKIQQLDSDQAQFRIDAWSRWWSISAKTSELSYSNGPKGEKTIIAKNVLQYAVKDLNHIIILGTDRRVRELNLITKEVQELGPSDPKIYSTNNKRYIHISSDGTLTSVADDRTVYNPYRWNEKQKTWETMGTLFNITNPVFGFQDGYFYIEGGQLFYRLVGEWNMNTTEQIGLAGQNLLDFIPTGRKTGFAVSQNGLITLIDGSKSTPWVAPLVGAPLKSSFMGPGRTFFAVQGSSLFQAQLPLLTEEGAVHFQTQLSAESVAPSGIGATMPFFMFRDQVEAVFEYVSGDHWREYVALSGSAPANKTRSNEPLFYVFQNASEELRPLYRCYVGSDHFISIDRNCEGFHLDRILGYVHMKQEADARLVPLNRCHLGSAGHGLTLNGRCNGAVENALGYVYPGDLK